MVNPDDKPPGGQTECHDGILHICFDHMPILIPKSTVASSGDHLDRLAIATHKRKFYLAQEWRLQVSGITDSEDLNGEIVIPTEENSKSIEFDGASIPLPWLISVLTIGILRPLGVMLLASIIHDFAYKFGYLWVENNGQKKKVNIERHHADNLLRDTLSTINKIPFINQITWFFVRLGWLGVPYAGEIRGGKIPYTVLVAAAIISLILIMVITRVGIINFIGCLAIFVFIAWLTTVVVPKLSG